MKQPSSHKRSKELTEELHDIASQLSILYVEDETDIRELVTEGFLKRLFKNVHVADNGKQGLEIYHQQPIDLIISDIRMPHMNGLQMSKTIKEDDPDIPIIITTAHSDYEYLIESITLGIDRYLVKPITETSLLETLSHVLHALDDRQRAEEMRKIETQRQINESAKAAMENLSDSLIAPIAILNGTQLIYLNDSLRELIPRDKLEAIQQGDERLDSIFHKSDNYIQTLEEIDCNEDGVSDCPARAMIVTHKKKAVFQISKRPLSGNDDTAILIFQDVTTIEKQRMMIKYQKNKIANYNELLEDILITKFFRSPADSGTPKPPPASEASPEKQPKPQPQQPTSSEPLSDSPEPSHVDALLSHDERNALRRHHKHKISAQEYVAELDHGIQEEIVILGEIERDIEEQLNHLIADCSQRYLRLFADALTEYASSLRLLIEFQDLSNALMSLASFLQEISEEEATIHTNKIILFLQNIAEDLFEWRSKIFIAQETQDIHYLDSSLFSSCIQMQYELSAQDDQENSSDDSDNDLELF